MREYSYNKIIYPKQFHGETNNYMWATLSNKELGYSLFILTNFNNFSCLNLLSVIIHEYGYFIHDIYFHNQSFPITDSTRENSVEEIQEKNCDSI